MAPSINTTKDAKIQKRKLNEVDEVFATLKKEKKEKKETTDEKPKKKVKTSCASPAAAAVPATTSPTTASPAAPTTLSAEQYRASHDITVKGVPAPDVYQTFDAAPFPDALKNALKAAGFAAPSPIQVRCETYSTITRLPPLGLDLAWRLKQTKKLRQPHQIRCHLPLPLTGPGMAPGPYWPRPPGHCQGKVPVESA